ELLPGEERVDRVALRDKADRAVEARIAPAGRALHGQLAARRREEPGDQAQHGRLPRSVRSEQAGDTRADGHRDVVDRDHVAVPARHVAQLDGAHSAPAFRYRANRPPTLAASSTRNMAP